MTLYSQTGHSVRFQKFPGAFPQPITRKYRCIFCASSRVAASAHNSRCLQTIGSLRVICEVLKSGPVEEVLQAMPLILHIQEAVENGSAHTTNAVMRKLKVKMISRLALRALPPRAKAHRKGAVFTLLMIPLLKGNRPHSEVGPRRTSRSDRC
jgi:hypothetical protein